MGQLAAVTPQIGYSLTVLSGADKGAVYKLVSGRISIGRGNENGIIIHDDPKVSRQHALVIIGPSGVQINDTSEHNKMSVNGETVKAANLNSGAIIQLGETKLMFKTVTLGTAMSALEQVDAGSSALDLPNDNLYDLPARPKKAKFKSRQGNPVVFVSIIAIVVAAAFWLMMQSTKNKGGNDLGGDDQIQSTVETDQKIVKEIEARHEKAGMNTPQYQEAQRHFIAGFREYEKGEFDRAIESFQACEALFPHHPLCDSYLKNARQRFAELIQDELNLGSKYKDQGQYSACVAAYRNVMYMTHNQVVDNSQKLFDLAQAGLSACQALGGQSN